MFRGNIRERGIVLLILLMLPLSVALATEPPTARESGLRAGSGDGFDTLSVYFRQPAPVVERHLVDPWLPSGVRARWDLSLAYWDGSEDDHAFVAFGPALEARGKGNWRLSLGVQPTLISGHDGNGEDLGGPFQFTSHLGIAWAPPGALVIGLRIQHTSNARLYDSNPGVDVVAAEVGYAF